MVAESLRWCWFCRLFPSSRDDLWCCTRKHNENTIPDTFDTYIFKLFASWKCVYSFAWLLSRERIVYAATWCQSAIQWVSRLNGDRVKVYVSLLLILFCILSVSIYMPWSGGGSGRSYGGSCRACGMYEQILQDNMVAHPGDDGMWWAGWLGLIICEWI